LNWEERAAPTHAAALALHRALLHLRGAHPALRASNAFTCEARENGRDAVTFVRPSPDRTFLVVARLRGKGEIRVPELSETDWRVELDTEDPAFAVDPQAPAIDAENGTIEFKRAGALMFARA
jgi:pullulanase/glycogen debranching enzyme